MTDGNLASGVQNVQQIIADLALNAMGIRPILRAEQELKSLVKTFPLLIWELSTRLREWVTETPQGSKDAFEGGEKTGNLWQFVHE